MIETEAQPFDRSAVLTRTPEQIAEDEAAHEAAAERLRPLVTDSVAVAQYKNACGVVAAMARSKRIDYARLAEAQFWKGQFYDAIQTLVISGNTDMAKDREYRDFWQAMQDVNGTQCDCAPIQIRIPGSAKGEPTPARREIQRVYVDWLQREVAFIKCERCKGLFAQTV